MIDWMEMTEAQREEANEAAWACAADRLRQTLAQHPEMALADARRFAFAAIEADIKENQCIIQRAKRTRATKLDKRFAASSRARIQSYSLAQGFIFDVEI